ncbi:MAG: hypothetical protein LBB74_04685 [Chitinispirillales bacterium]|jgi:hypothetical protein|nr:hypothetical protein [Chitinispirillales bacterium]
MWDLQTPRGTVVGIWRIKIHKAPEQGFDYEIPLLSSIGIKRKDDRGFIATCIHLQIDGYGDTMPEANDDMARNVRSYLIENFRCAECKDDAWANLNELLKSNPEKGLLWDKYHEMEISLAKRGIPADQYAELRQKIRSLEDSALKSESNFSKKVQELQAEFKEKERAMEEEFGEKLRELEAELNDKDALISWWIYSQFPELDGVMAI